MQKRWGQLVLNTNIKSWICRWKESGGLYLWGFATDLWDIELEERKQSQLKQLAQDYIKNATVSSADTGSYVVDLWRGQSSAPEPHVGRTSSLFFSFGWIWMLSPLWDVSRPWRWRTRIITLDKEPGFIVMRVAASAGDDMSTQSKWFGPESVPFRIQSHTKKKKEKKKICHWTTQWLTKDIICRAQTAE